jgi:uncharacterized protein (DUF1015 family)
MATLTPFRALRPPPASALRVASPPYDVVSTEEARALAAGNPDSFLHVSRPEIDLPAGTDEHADEVHAQGARALADFRERGVLLQDPAPRFYVYAQRMGPHRQAGIAACASVEEYPRTASGSTRRRAPTRRTTGSATSTRSPRTTSPSSSPTARPPGSTARSRT